MINKKYLILAMMLGLNSACGTKNISQKTLIVTGLAPIASLITVIAGDKYDIRFIIPNNTDPHNFNLKPSDAIILAKADTIIALDNHFDGKILSTADNTVKFHLLNTESENTHEDHDHSNNPHLWISYKHLGDLSQKITEILIANFPENKWDFQKNNKTFNDRLEKYYQQIKNLYKDSDKKIFVVQRHNVWDYLLKELDIELIATLYEHEGEQVSVKKMVTIINKINEISNKDQIVMIDDAFTDPSTVLQAISDQTGVKIKVLNPMGSQDNTTIDPIDLLDIYSKLLIN